MQQTPLISYEEILNNFKKYDNLTHEEYHLLYKDTINNLNIVFVNNSDLSLMEVGPEYYYTQKFKDKLPEKKKKYYELGTLIHCLLFEPEEFDARYVTSDIKISDGIMKQFTDAVFNIITKEDKTYTLEKAKLEALNHIETKWKPDTVFKKFETEGYSEYLDQLFKTKGKKILSSKESEIFNTIRNNIVQTLKENEKLNDFIFPSSNLESLSEKILFFSLEGGSTVEDSNLILIGKCKPDRIIIDHEKCKIYLLDIKTTGKYINYFPKSYQHYKYYRQLAFYTSGIEQLYENYEIEQHIIVVETIVPYRIKDFVIDKKDIILGKMEYKELVAKLRWHLENNKWSQESYDKNFVTRISTNDIVSNLSEDEHEILFTE
jgi:hypothetical protein